MIEEEKMKKIALIVLFVVMIIPMCFADGNITEDQVEVTLPGFDVTVNGNVIENRSEVYPFIVYKGITYLPMTWDMSYALGLELKWSEITGLQVNKRDKMRPYVSEREILNVTGMRFRADVVAFPVNVNGKQIDNKTEEYPLLNFRDITYFPMTYDYMVNMFNTSYKWDDEEGLMLKVDSSLEIVLPDPYTIEFDFYENEFEDDQLMSNEMAYLEKVGDEIYLRVNYNTHPEYDGYVIDVRIDYLDDLGNLIGTGYQRNRAVYEGLGDMKHVGYSKLIEVKDYSPRIKVKVNFEPYEIALARKDKEYPDVEVYYYNDTEISLESIKNMGASYIEGTFVGHSKDTYPLELLTYDAVECGAGSEIDDTKEKYYIYLKYDGTITRVKTSTTYVSLNKLTRLFVDPTQGFRQLMAMNGDVIIQNTLAHGIRLYDKDKKLIKILIQNSRLEELY